MPELPEIQAHAERLDATFAGRTLTGFRPLAFTALKTAVPDPSLAFGRPLRHVGRRGKYLLLEFEPVTFVVHLMQGGRLAVDTKLSPKPRNGQARFTFDGDPPALLLTEAGKERRAGVWCVDTATALTGPPLDVLGPEAHTIDVATLTTLVRAENRRIHGFLRDQRAIAGIGRRLANEVCHRARFSPFAMTSKLTADDIEALVAAIHAAVADGLEHERAQPDMGASKERPGRVHGRAGEPCVACGDVIRSVQYSGYTVHYCATCQTDGRILADNTTSKFLK